MNYRSATALGIMILLGGTSFPLIKVFFGEMQPMAMAFIRSLISVPLLVSVAYYLNPNLKAVLKNWKALLLLGICGITVYQLFQNFGLVYATAMESSVLLCTDPIYIAIMASVFLKEKLDAKKIAGIAVAFAGMSTIVLRGSAGTFVFTPLGIFGDLLAIGGAFSWAVYSVYGKKVLEKVNPYDMTAYGALFGTAILGVLTFGWEGVSLPTSVNGWAILIYLGLGVSGVAYLMWFVALEGLSAYQAGTGMFFVPLVGIIASAVLLGETLDLVFGIGALLVIIGMYITIR
jgi:drug/metabolite transporter (DMT)-like permease